MSEREQTKVMSVHKYRRVARWHERRLQKKIARAAAKGIYWTPDAGYPFWARGARTERVPGVHDGDVQFAVVATSHRGH